MALFRVKFSLAVNYVLPHDFAGKGVFDVLGGAQIKLNFSFFEPQICRPKTNKFFHLHLLSYY